MPTTIPVNTDHVLDSRDVIAALETSAEDRTDADRIELAALAALAGEGESLLDDWEYGVTLVRDTYFTRYAEEYAIDCGLVDPAALWPACYIDWERAAADLQVDYTPLDFAGVTYWAR